MKRVAIIMSVYKNDRLSPFQRCIDSLLQQTYQGGIDIWIQFDGSIIPEIVTYLENLNRDNILFYKREVNKGLAISLNELLERVLKRDYEYIARMDADDISTLDRLKLQVEYMERNPDIDILGGSIEEMDEQENTRMTVRYPLIHNEMKVMFGHRNPIAHMTVIFRKSYFEKAGMYPTDTNKDEDTIFWLNGFMKGGRFSNIEQVLVRVRVSDDFYKRRNGFMKSYSDFKNRCRVIKELELSYKNYILAFARFCVFIIPSPKVTYWAYKLLRN